MLKRILKHLFGHGRMGIVLTYLIGCSAVHGQITQPPTIHWIGPENSCDYPDIQTAIEDIFDCFLCRPQEHQLRLSPTYSHQGKITIGDEVGIVGGFTACQGLPTGTQHVLNNSGPGALLSVSDPSARPVRVALTNLILIGNNSVNTLGGVVDLAGGANLSLFNSRVSFGQAVQGGGIAMHGDNNRLTLVDSVISANIAIEDGGGIWCQDGGVIDFQSGHITGNSAQTRGGGVGLDNCRLAGNVVGEDRFVRDNRVERGSTPDAPGKGGGIYARGNQASVVLGTTRSRTIIENNRVARWTTNEFDRGLSANGGGIHVQGGASLVLRNANLIDNEAPAGGAIGAQSGARVDIDRTPGPCLAARASECSSLVGNGASGTVGTAGGGSRVNGPGAAIFGESAGLLTLRRSALRDNISFDPDAGDAFGSLLYWRDSDDAVIEQNLIFNNAIEGNDFNHYFHLVGSTPHFHGNTIAFNNDAENIFFLGQNSFFEAVSNIIWDPEQQNVSAFDHPAVLSTCNVLERSLPAVQRSFNSLADPEFVNVGSADFHLAATSPAINRCDDQGQRLTPTFDIEGRVRPARDGNEPDPLGGYYDSGAFEFHQGPANEVDLAVSVTRTDDDDLPGAEVEVVLTNLGLTSANFGNFSLRFIKPAEGYQKVGPHWSCVEDPAGQEVEVSCALFIASGLASPLTTLPLVLGLNPDGDGQCELTIAADSGQQPDVVANNDRVRFSVPDCDGDGVLLEEIFFDSFESP